MTTVIPTLQYQAGTVWYDVTSDMVAGSLRWSGGIRGGGPTDRVAVPGILEVTMRSDQYNSAGSIGYYSPDHANARAGWDLGTKIRVKLQSGGNTRYWMYRIRDIRPKMGQYRERQVDIVAKDYMEEFSSRKVSGLTIQTNKRGDELLGTAVAGMPYAPVNTSYDTGAFTFAYAFHDERDEDTSLITVVQKITQSELSYVYPDGDATDGETLHYESHLTRFKNIVASGTLDNSMIDLTLVRTRDNIYNKVKAVTYPVDVDTSLSVLGQIPEEFALEPGETKAIEIRYIDIDTSRRISGIDPAAPVANTDYKMSSKQGDGGSDLNASLSVIPTAGANTLSAAVTNSGTVLKGYVNTLQIRGRRVTLYDKVEAIKSGTASIAAYGEKTLTYNMPYQNNSSFGDAAASEILRRYQDPTSHINGVVFVANENSTLMSYALTHGIGTRENIVEAASGISADFFINGFEYELRQGNLLYVSWVLERAFNTTAYFTIDHTTYGVLDSAYVVAPF